MNLEEMREIFLAVTNDGVDCEHLFSCLTDDPDPIFDLCIEADYKRDKAQQIVFEKIGEHVYHALFDHLEGVLTSPSIEPLVRSHEAAQLALMAHEDAQEAAVRESAPGTVSEIMEEIYGEITR